MFRLHNVSVSVLQGLEPYSWYRAQGNFILTSLREEQRAPSIFVDFAPLSYDDRADLLFITDRWTFINEIKLDSFIIRMSCMMH